MELVGKLIKINPAKGGTSKKGTEWKSQSIVLDNGSDFNNEVCIEAFGDKGISQLRDLKIGSDMKVLCNIYSQEYNGTYYNKISGYHFASTNQTPVSPTQIEEGIDHKGGDDLPF